MLEIDIRNIIVFKLNYNYLKKYLYLVDFKLRKYILVNVVRKKILSFLF